MSIHPNAYLMFRIQITETPVLRFPRIKLCRGVHILKGNRIFTVAGLRDPLRFAVFLPVVILQSNPFIEPSRNPFLCFGGKARAQFRMGDLVRQYVEFEILVRYTDISPQKQIAKNILDNFVHFNKTVQYRSFICPSTVELNIFASYGNFPVPDGNIRLTKTAGREIGIAAAGYQQVIHRIILHSVPAGIRFYLPDV